MTHPHTQITETAIESYLLKELDRIYLARIKEIKAKNKSVITSDVETKRKKMEAKLKRLALLFEDGDIEQAEYIEKRNNIKYELSQLEVQTIPEPVPLPNEWALIYNDLDQNHKQAFWRSIIDHIEVDNDTKENPRIVFL